MRLIGHGIDIIEVERIEAMLAEHGQRMLDRLFTEGEQAECSGGDAAAPTDVRRAHRLAARFAAKEAVLKALGTGLADGIGWADVEVETLATGAPSLRLSGRAAEVAAGRGITQWSISLTHTRQFAAASALAMGDDR